MIQLALLLVGVQAAQRHWLTLASLGAIWGALGFGILVDPLDGVQNITMHTLGLLLVFEGLATLALGLLAHSAGPLRLSRALAFIVPGLMIVETPWRNVVLISVLFGLALLVDGMVRIASTLLVRFPGWRAALGASAIELVLAVLRLSPLAGFLRSDRAVLRRNRHDAVELVRDPLGASPADPARARPDHLAAAVSGNAGAGRRPSRSSRRPMNRQSSRPTTQG